MMKCPECIKEEKNSKVYPGMITRTLMGYYEYYDEQGKYHIHDNNITNIDYRCSNNHEFSDKSSQKCWCGE